MEDFDLQSIEQKKIEGGKRRGFVCVCVTQHVNHVNSLLNSSSSLSLLLPSFFFLFPSLNFAHCLSAIFVLFPSHALPTLENGELCVRVRVRVRVLERQGARGGE